MPLFVVCGIHTDHKMADSDDNTLRTLQLEGVSKEVRNRLVATQAVVALMLAPGERWTVPKMAERLKLTNGQIRAILASQEFADIAADQAPRHLIRTMAKGAREIEEILDGESGPQVKLSAIKTATTLYKALTEMAPKQEQQGGIAAVRDITESLRNGETNIRLLQEQAKQAE